MKQLILITLLLTSCSSAVPHRGPAEDMLSKCFQIIKNFLPTNDSEKLDYKTIRKRYTEHYDQLFTGMDLSKIKSLKINYEDIVGSGLGETDLVSHSVTLDERLKGHPTSFIFQIHETQHYYDLKIGKLTYTEVHDDIQVSSLEILDSEIRAHLRHLQAAKILFSDKEFGKLLEMENDPKIKKFLKEIVDYGDSPNNYVAMILSEGGYLNFLKKAAQESNRSDYKFFLIERIEKIADESL